MINIKNSKTLISIAALLQVVFILITSSAISKGECDGPTKFIKVTVKQVSTSPPTYIYTITNIYQSSIRNFTLGVSDHKELRIMPDNIPANVESPQGWQGQYVFGEDSDYMHIFWNVVGNQFEIVPGTSVTGFKLIMPQPVKSKERLYYSDGTPAVPHDMKKTPFKVRFKDGTCVWGKVRDEP